MKLFPVKSAVMVKILEKAGFFVKRQRGSHIILYKPDQDFENFYHSL